MNSTRQHSSREYEAELHKLRDALLAMGGRVEAALGHAVNALVSRDDALARATIAADREIDRDQIQIDEHALRIMALRQPVSSDLRFLVAAFRINTDLERVGDLCVNFCERVLELNSESQLKPYIDLPRMAGKVSGLLRLSLDAYVTGDVEQARAVLAGEQAIDDLNLQIFRELVSFMVEDPRTITRAMRLIFIAKYLERIADHATNIAEQVIFMVKGSDVRHGLGFPGD